MKTKIYQIKDESDKSIDEVGELLRSGALAAIPTESVYGLAANALDPQAVSRIFEAKGRPQDNPLIVHISSFDEIYPLVKEVPDSAKALADKFWPGPLTIILKKTELVPSVVSAGMSLLYRPVLSYSFQASYASSRRVEWLPLQYAQRLV